MPETIEKVPPAQSSALPAADSNIPTPPNKKRRIAALLLSKTAILLLVSGGAAAVLVAALVGRQSAGAGQGTTLPIVSNPAVVEQRPTNQSQRLSLAQRASNANISEESDTTDRQITAFPDGTADHTAPRATTSKTKTGDPIIRRSIREPITHPASTSGTSKETNGKRPGGVAPAGQPGIRSNGQQVLVESLGKIRSGGSMAPTTAAPGAASEPATIHPIPGPAVTPAEVESDRAKLEDDFAPYGRLIKCKLVFTVDSVNLSTPIVGLVMEDVWWNGKLIIPAATEVFSKAAPKYAAERIGDEGKWTFVLPKQADRINGRELVLRGFALDRSEVEVETKGRVRTWSLSDGAAGLHGFVVDEMNEDKVKLFIATAISGAVQSVASGLQTQESIPGIGGALGLTQAKATLKNSAISGVGGATKASLDLLSKQIMDEIEQHGSYIRVPAGTEFYVFVDQTIDPQQAAVGKRLANEK